MADQKTLAPERATREKLAAMEPNERRQALDAMTPEERAGLVLEYIAEDEAAVREDWLERMGPEERRGAIAQRINERLKAVGLSARAASLKAGQSADFVRTIIDGRSRSPGAERMKALADVLQCDVRYLLLWKDEPGEVRSQSWPRAPDTQALLITHEVAAGAWLEVDDLRDEPLGSFPAHVIPGYERFPQWMELVKGDSYNLKIPDGYLVQVVDAVAMGYAPRHGDTVVVVRRRAQGALIERSLKEVVQTPFGWELWPRSHNPKWDQPLIYGVKSERDDVDLDIEVEVVGRVLQAYAAPGLL